jgi:glycosyltransferase involved in cell wall biosynthesis
MKRLLVIGEVDITKEGTRNNSLNIILKEYTPFFEEIHYLGPSKIKDNFTVNGCYFHPYRNYSKDYLKRIQFIIFFPFYKRQLLKIIRSINPDIIQVRIPSIFVMLTYSAINKDIPVTSYIAGEWDTSFAANYKKVPFSKSISKLLYNLQIEIIKNTITVTAGDLLKQKLSNINLCYAYFSTTHKTVHKRQQIQHPAYNILSIGRLEPLKRYEDAIFALEKLLKISDKYQLTILGNGKLLVQLTNLIKRLNIETHVKFLGYISDKTTLINIFKDNDILLHTSISEGSPKVLPEAMSYGLVPIAVRNVGSINSIIKDKSNGFLIEPKSPESIYNMIVAYNDLDITTVSKIIENCYDYAEEHSIEKEVAKMWNYVFERVK